MKREEGVGGEGCGMEGGRGKDRKSYGRGGIKKELVSVGEIRVRGRGKHGKDRELKKLRRGATLH